MGGDIIVALWTDTIPEKKVEIRSKIEETAKKHGLLINPYTEHKIAWSETHGGVCNCDKSRTCPCNQLQNDLNIYNGACLCRVFVTEEKMKKIEKQKEREEKKKNRRKILPPP